MDAGAGVAGLPPLGGPKDPYFSGAGGAEEGGRAAPPGGLSTWGELLARGSPEEGLRDLALITALLESSQKGGAPVLVQDVPGPEMYAAAAARDE